MRRIQCASHSTALHSMLRIGDNVNRFHTVCLSLRGLRVRGGRRNKCPAHHVQCALALVFLADAARHFLANAGIAGTQQLINSAIADGGKQ